MRGHPPFPAQLAVGEVDEEVRPLLNGHVVVEWIVLAELERLEAIDDDFIDWRAVAHHLVVEEQAMPAQAGDVSVDGFRGHSQVTGDLPVGHPSGGLHDDQWVQVWAFLPVGS